MVSVLENSLAVGYVVCVVSVLENSLAVGYVVW